MKRFLIFLVSPILLSACGPKVQTSLARQSYTPLAYDEDVMVVYEGEPLPADTLYLGNLKIGDKGFSTKCSYEIAIAAAKLEARKAGGNLLQITEHKTPDAFSTCHRIKARILKMEDRAALEAFKAKSEARFIDTTLDYALLHIYRPSTYGYLVNYKLHLGDSVLCKVRTRFKTTLKIRVTGRQVLWARTESREDIFLEIEHGHQYFLKCGLGTGVMVGRPVLELIPPSVGQQEFDKLKAKN